MIALLPCSCLAQQASTPSAKPGAEPGWQVETSGNLMPHFESVNARNVLYVDGRPFTVLAVEIPWWDLLPKQPETYSTYDYLYPAAERMRLNSLKVPVKWSMVEPEPGVYDFSYVDHAKAVAEKHHLKLVLNWFGHYASGDGTIYGNLRGLMYAPSYVINDESTYPRAVDADGVPHHNTVSYDYDGVIEREIAAFRRFMEHIKQVDSQAHTILMIQVENEIAVFGFDRQNRKLWRDHSPASNRIYAEKGFTDDLKFSAWSLSSRWIRRLTDAGAAIYPLPFFHNYVGVRVADWMVGGAPGEDVATYLENCPHLSFIGVNSYFCAQWRPDNSCAKQSEATIEELREPLLRYRVGRNLPAITEVNSGPEPVASRLAFLAIGEFGAPIFAPWALNVSYPAPYAPYVLKDGTLANGAFALRDAYSALSMAIAPISYFAASERLKVFMSRSPGQPFTQTESVNGFGVIVKGENDGQAIVIRPSEHELVLVGYRCNIILHDPLFAWPGIQKVRVEKGRWASKQWIQQGEAAYGFNQSSKTLEVDLDSPQAVRVRW